MVAAESAVMMNKVPTCSTGDLTTVTLTQGGQMSLAARKANHKTVKSALPWQHDGLGKLQCWDQIKSGNLTHFNYFQIKQKLNCVHVCPEQNSACFPAHLPDSEFRSLTLGSHWRGRQKRMRMRMWNPTPLSLTQ